MKEREMGRVSILSILHLLLLALVHVQTVVFDVAVGHDVSFLLNCQSEEMER